MQSNMAGNLSSLSVSTPCHVPANNAALLTGVFHPLNNAIRNPLFAHDSQILSSADTPSASHAVHAEGPDGRIRRRGLGVSWAYTLMVLACAAISKSNKSIAASASAW